MKTVADFPDQVEFPERADKRTVDDYNYWANEIAGSPFKRSEGGTREFDKRARDNPLMTEHIGPREAPGFRKARRKEKNGQVYGWERRDPFVIARWDPLPSEVQNMFRDVFGRRIYDGEGRTRLRLVMHPHLKRVCIIERHFDPKRSEEQWVVIWVCQQKARKGHLPIDYRGQQDLAHLTSRVGDFKMPEEEELAAIERCDRKKYGVNRVEAYVHQFEVHEELETNRKMDNFTEGFLDYYFDLAMDDANQQYGSGQRMRSVDTIVQKSNEERWKRDEKEGYTIITRKTRDQRLREKFDQAVVALGESRATEIASAELLEVEKQEAHGRMSRYRSAKQLDKRRQMILEAYEHILLTSQTREDGKMRSLTKKEAAMFLKKQLGKR